MSDVNTGSVVNATAFTNSDNADAPFVQYKVPFGVAALRYLKGFTSKGRSSRSDFWYGLLFGFVLDLGVDGVKAIRLSMLFLPLHSLCLMSIFGGVECRI